MNAKWRRRGLSSLLAVLLWPSPVLAAGLDSLLADPLQTMPELVAQGIHLPGDTAPPPCQEPHVTTPLVLGEAVNLALCNNPQIKSAWADIKVQAGAAGEARAAYLPTLAGSISRTNDQIHYSDSRYPASNVDRNTAQASINWRIFDFGGRTANRQAADNLLAAALANHNATVQRVLADVVQAYFDGITADAALQAKTENEKLARIVLNSAQVREERGVISQSDTLRAATSLARATLEKSRAQGDYQKTLAVLRHTLGLPGNMEISLPQELSSNPGEKESQDELDRWLLQAQRNHPAIIAAQKQVEAAEQRVAVARSAGLPTMNLSGNYYRNTRPGEAVTSTEAQETTLGLTVSVPIFDGFSSTYKLRGAESLVEEKTASLADTQRRTAAEVIKAHADATSALRNLDSSLELLTTAQNSLAVSQRKYDRGAADISEILSTQAALADAWQERIRCLAEWHSARLRLLASAGLLGRASLTE